ncbi:S8 family peptidase [Acetivibrio mesophilus]|uniref:Peptidase S8 n=1 Tax=Acetivibrio mesophilus TaxID=2487273 RepID=A0A4Q0I2R0_9FIRM|nr:S8 family serine peptidase [Acetivibrio mesophilus]RXE58496.1 peptidase S8 [Acetivibrio mesophilus]
MFTVFSYRKDEYMKVRVFFAAILAVMLFTAPSYAAEPESIRIAVIDTGISTVAISEKNLDEGCNYILSGATTEDTVGHGTAVAAIIAGSEAAGITGLYPEAVLVPLVYYSKNGNDAAVKGDLSMLAQIIRDAVDVYDCRIINISSGARVDTPDLRDAVAWAEQRGVLVVSCAGNDGDGTGYYPGAFSTVLCAGAVNSTEDGSALFSNRHSGVDLLAPGIKLKTANLKGEAVTVNGTSYSTAWVSGAAAALLAIDPTLTPYQLRQLLRNTARDICDEGYDEESGWGVMDLDAAIAKLRAESGKQLPFSDVSEGAYYRQAVEWALKNGITGGTTSTTFSPDMSCTRAQTVAFLWRSAGCPEPRLTENPFIDVAETDYFYKAVLWAVEKEITSGTSDTTFSPSEACNEAQIITFLWRSKNCPDPAGRSRLAAGLGEHYYTDAVAWADIHGFFATAQTDFIPMREAPRAHIVVYLYHSVDVGH